MHVAESIRSTIFHLGRHQTTISTTRMSTSTTMDMLATPDGASSAVGPLSSALSNLGSSPRAVGAAWLISSAVFTTYSTTKFLQFGYEDDRESLKVKMERTPLPAKRPSFIQQFFSLPPPIMLTLWRFLGSLLLGLLVQSDFAVMSRVKQTLDLVPLMALPALFLFIANMANSYVTVLAE